MPVMTEEIAKPFKLRRSALITPGDDEALLAKSARSAADVAVIEWEDGVFASRKPLARDITASALDRLDWSGREVVVRINGVGSSFFPDDIQAVAALPIAGIRVPKVAGVEDVLKCVDALAAAERSRRPKRLPPLDVWISIESARALLAVEDIARCSPRLAALTFGGGDLGADLGLKRLLLGEGRPLGPLRYEYLYGQSRTIAAARAYGLDVLNMGYTSYKDLEGTRWDAEFAAQLGFSGCIALSVRQLEAINAAFSPSREDVAWAETLLKDFQASTSTREKTVIVVESQMADGPFVRNASRIMAMKQAIDAKHASRKLKA